MSDNIDSLLEDLDHLIDKPTPPSSTNVTASSSSGPFRVPRRPSNEKSPTQLNNPKNRFVSSPLENAKNENVPNSSSYNSSSSSSHPSSSSSSYNSSSSSNKNDMESIDSLLNLLDESSPPAQRSGNGMQTSSSSSSSQNSQRSGISSRDAQNNQQRNNEFSSSGLPSQLQSSMHSESQSQATSEGLSGVLDDDFESLLSDLNDSLPSLSMEKAANSGNADKGVFMPPARNNSSRGGKCSRVVLGGSSFARGIKCSAFSKSVCDSLRCIKCNFEAIQFSGKSWSSTVDYMFFRNNMPNKEKLSTQLVHRPGSVAYCCQCSWISVEDEIVLSAGLSDKPQWVCAGH